MKRDGSINYGTDNVAGATTGRLLFKHHRVYNYIITILAVLIFSPPSTAAETDDDRHWQEDQQDEWMYQGFQERHNRQDLSRKERRKLDREERERQKLDREERRRREWRVRSVDFYGNCTYTPKELLSLMELKPKWPKYDTRFTSFLMNADLDALRMFYRGGGFEYAEVKLDRVERDSTARQVRVHIAITEGPRIHVSDVRVEAERFVPKHSDMKKLLTRPGEPLIHSNVRQDCRQLKEILGQRGYLLAEVQPDFEFDSLNNLAGVIFDVIEGPVAVVASVQLEGNKWPKDSAAMRERFFHSGIMNSVLRRELVFRRRDTLNLKLVQQSERRLYSTGLFNYVQIKPVFDTTRAIHELPDSAYKVQVLVHLSEFMRLQGRVGFSTDEGFMAAATATYMNMLARGQTLTLDGKVSQMTQRAEALYTIPGLLYMPFQFNTKIYYDRFDNAELYQSALSGIRLSIDKRADYHFLYQIWTQWEMLQWIRVPDADTDATESPTQSFGGNVGLDTRDNLFTPTSGSFTNLELEFAGLFGGNYNQFVKIAFDTRHYFSRRSRYFLSSALRTGWITPYGSSETVPSQYRFYGGGGNTVRGFPVNRLAVQPNDAPLLGNFYTFFNVADIRFPIYWWFNGAVFLDAGNVWPDFNDIKSFTGFLDDLRWSAGPGLRVDTPIKLVARLDFGFKLDHRPGESKWELHFDLGQPF